MTSEKRDEGSPILSPPDPKDGERGAISLVEFVEARRNFEEPLSTVCERCVRLATPYLESQIRNGYRCYLLANSGWLTAGAVSRKNGLWGGQSRVLSDSTRSSIQLEKSHPSASKGPQQISFTAGLEYDLENLYTMAEPVRLNDRGNFFAVLSRRDLCEASAVEEFYAQILRPSGEFWLDWHRLVWFYGLRGDLVLRPWGGFDDREVALQVFCPASGGAGVCRGNPAGI